MSAATRPDPAPGAPAPAGAASQAGRELPPLNPRARAAVMAAVMLGLFMSALDQTIVGTALPRIVTDLHGNGLYTWVVTAYLLTSTVSVPIYGKLSDVYGRKPLILVAIGLFVAGSALSGLSQTMGQLIAFRGVQGLGAGGIMPIALAIIGDLFSPRERGRYQGLFGATFGISFIIGPFLGGFLTDNASWHWIFYVNLPVGIAALAVVVAALPPLSGRPGVRVRDLDFVGVALFTAFAVLLLIGLTNKGLTDSGGRLNGWTSPSVATYLGASAVLLLAFLAVEARAKEPVIPLDLFRNRTYTAANVATFFVSFGLFSTVIFLPRFFQAVRGESATRSGYETWPLMLGLILASTVTGFLITRTGRYKKLIVGSTVLLGLGGLLLTNLRADTGDAALWFWMALAGLGVGPTFSGLTTALQNAVPLARLGTATSNLTFFRQIGGSVGLAIAGTLFSQRFASDLPGNLAAARVPPQAIARVASQPSALTGVGDLGSRLAQVLPPQARGVAPRIATAVQDTLAASIGHLMWLALAGAVFAFLAVLAMPELPLRGRPRAAEAAAAASQVATPETALSV